MQGGLVLNATRTAQVIANVKASVPSRERRAETTQPFQWGVGINEELEALTGRLQTVGRRVSGGRKWSGRFQSLTTTRKVWWGTDRLMSLCSDCGTMTHLLSIVDPSTRLQLQTTTDNVSVLVCSCGISSQWSHACLLQFEWSIRPFLSGIASLSCLLQLHWSIRPLFILSGIASLSLFILSGIASLSCGPSGYCSFCPASWFILYIRRYSQSVVASFK